MERKHHQPPLGSSLVAHARLLLLLLLNSSPRRATASPNRSPRRKKFRLASRRESSQLDRPRLYHGAYMRYILVWRCRKEMPSNGIPMRSILRQERERHSGRLEAGGPLGYICSSRRPRCVCSPLDSRKSSGEQRTGTIAGSFECTMTTDIFCLNETKVDDGALKRLPELKGGDILPGYHAYWVCSTKKGAWTVSSARLWWSRVHAGMSIIDQRCRVCWGRIIFEEGAVVG